MDELLKIWNVVGLWPKIVGTKDIIEVKVSIVYTGTKVQEDNCITVLITSEGIVVGTVYNSVETNSVKNDRVFLVANGNLVLIKKISGTPQTGKKDNPGPVKNILFVGTVPVGYQITAGFRISALRNVHLKRFNYSHVWTEVAD